MTRIVRPAITATVTAGTTESASDVFSKSGLAGMRVYVPSTVGATNMKVYGRLRDDDDFVLCQDDGQSDADFTIVAGRIIDITKYVYGVPDVKIVLNTSGTVTVRSIG